MVKITSDSTCDLSKQIIEEKNIGIRASDCFPYLGLCAFAEPVFSVTGFLVKVGLGEPVEDFRAGADVVIASERDHFLFV